jgi:hypothetical protein
MSRTLRAGAVAGALVIGVVAGGSANLALARSPIMAPSQPTAQSTTDQVTAAIQQVIQQANAEQVKAISTGDASVMGDTATADHLAELQQNNQDMSDSGVTDIQLMRLDWGPISVTGDTAKATTYETWSVHGNDGSTQVSRDTNVYTLVQDNGAWKIQADDHPTNGSSPASGASTAPSTSPSPAQSIPGFPGFPFPFVTVPGDGTGVTTPVPGRAPGTTRPQPQPRSTTQPNPAARPSQDTSHNWSGYAAGNGKYTSLTGTWTIPQVSSNGAPGVGATWVGIGGVTSRDLIQAGTQETDGGSGRVQYSAWVETLPQVSEPVPFAVRPGDSVTVTIAEQSANNWSIDFKNNTTGKTYHTTKRYTSSHSSAEWVVEAPSSGVGVLPLDNFGNVSFTDASATLNGQSADLSQMHAQPITMLGGSGQQLAVPSGIGTDGGSFSVSRTQAPATSVGTGRGLGSGFSSRPGVGSGSGLGSGSGVGSGSGLGSGSGVGSRPSSGYGSGSGWPSVVFP